MSLRKDAENGFVGPGASAFLPGHRGPHWKCGALRSAGARSAGHDVATEQQQQHSTV